MYDQEITGQMNEGQATAVPEATSVAPTKGEPDIKRAEEISRAPEPMAIGDEKIAILKHDIYRKGGEGDATESIGIDLAVKNVSGKPIGSVLFNVVLYDIEGNILDTAEHKVMEIESNASRNLRINYSGPKSDKVKSYRVRVAKTALTPEPTATGNEKILIFRHSMAHVSLDERGIVGIDLAIRNVSDVAIATAIFEADFYDIEGNVLETVQRKEEVLNPDASRSVNIRYAGPHVYSIKSYSLRLTRMTTVDFEKVKLISNEIITTENDEEEVTGIVKNISQVKTDAAVVAMFSSIGGENIGTRVVVLRDIEPNTVRKFRFLFKPQEGDVAGSCTLNIGDVSF